MNKTAIIIIAILGLLVIAQVYISSTNHDYYKDEITDLRKKQASTAKQLKAITEKYNGDSIQNERNMADYMVSLAQVERYKTNYANALKRERDAIQANKEILRYSDLQLDSAFRAMYPSADSSLR